MIKPFSKRIHWHATSQREKSERFPNAKIKLIPDGTFINKHSYNSEMDDNQWKNQYYIACLKITQSKAYDIIINAMPSVLKTPQLKLIIAGDDEGTEPLKESPNR